VQLLVSVRDTVEAQAALLGGADVIDAKDPAAGPLGAVSSDALRAIRWTVGAWRPVSAALGDASSETDIEATAHDAACCGPAYVKLGFAGVGEATRVRALLDAAMRGVSAARTRTAVIAVGYADAERVGSVPPLALIAIAHAAGAAGVLVDTARKEAGALLSWMTTDALEAWIETAHEARLLASVAGRLGVAELPIVRDLGADFAGVRGAACEGGRAGRLSTSLVRQLRAAVSGAERAGGNVATEARQAAFGR
jgi:(5-formylfuran-3-yl)methyl phosphate synthase